VVVRPGCVFSVGAVLVIIAVVGSVFHGEVGGS